MPVHDWTRVEAGIFHDFHVAWIPEIRKVLNGGLLPEGYYALAEQHAGTSIADVLTLHASPEPIEPWPLPPPDTGGIAVAEAPPRVRRITTIEPLALTRRRSLAIRHVSGHRLIALIEIVSRANKDRPDSLDEFAAKAVASLDRGVHLLVIDLFPPGPHDREVGGGRTSPGISDPRHWGSSDRHGRHWKAPSQVRRSSSLTTVV